MRRLVREARVARLATTEAGGRPHLVPLCFALAGDVLYSAVDRKPKRSPRLKRLENIRRHPNVTVLVDHYEEDWRRLWWVRADGRARVVEPEDPEARRAIALLAERYPQQVATGAVLAVDVERWSGWEASSVS